MDEPEDNKLFFESDQQLYQAYNEVYFTDHQVQGNPRKMPLVKKRSPIWEYFDINSDNNKFADCFLCGVQISRGGEGKRAGTSAMHNHLKTKHPESFQAISKGKAAEISTPSFAAPSTSASSKSTEEPPSFESSEMKLFWDVNGPEAKKYHYLLAEMIALDNEPLSIVDRPGFSRLLQQALPRYQMPSAAYVSQKIVPDIYDRIYEKIKRKISDSLAVSVTCLHDNGSLSLTAHWVSPEFQLEHGVLAIKSFPDSHTGEKITKELNTIAARWDIDQSKIHVLLHNMVQGFRVAEYDSGTCFIHSLQRVVIKALEVQPEVVETIDTGRRLVTNFNHSSLVQEKLLALQKEVGLPEHQLVQDVSTRWNSTFYMIERMLEQKRAISLYVADHDDTLTNLAPQQWYLMEQCVKLLKPFEEITKITSSGLLCISEVIPHVAALKKYLDKDETAQRTPDLPHMRASLKAELESRFSSLGQDLNYLIATFLDPRFKTNYLGAVEAEKARQQVILEYIQTSCGETSNSDNPTPAKKSRGDDSGSTVTREAHDTFWDCFNEVANENNANNSQIVIVSEIDYYLKSVRIDRSCDPYMWWSDNAKQYPNLTKFARIYLSAPCSSIFNEKLFSEGGLVYEGKRNRLVPQNAEKLVFIHHNLPLVNYDY